MRNPAYFDDLGGIEDDENDNNKHETVVYLSLTLFSYFGVLNVFPGHVYTAAKGMMVWAVEG